MSITNRRKHYLAVQHTLKIAWSYQQNHVGNTIIILFVLIWQSCKGTMQISMTYEWIYIYIYIGRLFVFCFGMDSYWNKYKKLKQYRDIHIVFVLHMLFCMVRTYSSLQWRHLLLINISCVSRFQFCIRYVVNTIKMCNIEPKKEILRMKCILKIKKTNVFNCYYLGYT